MVTDGIIRVRGYVRVTVIGYTGTEVIFGGAISVTGRCS